ncbi:MAG: response regulator [Pseudomonadota bacterium]
MATPDSDTGHVVESTHCLIIDDDRFDRLQLRTSIERGCPGLKVIEAGSLTDARQILERQSVDLILLDNNLPDGTGLGYARELSNGPAASAPVVMVSAELPGPLSSDALKAGCAATLSKDELSTRRLSEIASSVLTAGKRSAQSGDGDVQSVDEAINQIVHEIAAELRQPVHRSLRLAWQAKEALRNGSTASAYEHIDSLEDLLRALSDFLGQRRN